MPGCEGKCGSIDSFIDFQSAYCNSVKVPITAISELFVVEINTELRRKSHLTYFLIVVYVRMSASLWKRVRKCFSLRIAEGNSPLNMSIFEGLEKIARKRTHSLVGKMPRKLETSPMIERKQSRVQMKMGCGFDRQWSKQLGIKRE